MLYASHGVVKLTIDQSLIPSVSQLALTYTSYDVLDVKAVKANGLSEVAVPVSAGVAPLSTYWYSQAISPLFAIQVTEAVVGVISDTARSVGDKQSGTYNSGIQKSSTYM